MTATCPRCLCRLDQHTDADCIATVIEAARPFAAPPFRSECNAARNDVDVMIRVPWATWDKLRALVERSERGGE